MLYSLGDIRPVQANGPRLLAQFNKQIAEVLDGRRNNLLEQDRILIRDNQKPGTRFQPQLLADRFGNNDLSL